MSERIDTSSHDEKHILEGCISLMQQLVGIFSEYLNWMGFHPDPDDDDQWFHYEMSYFEIVNRLFLWKTMHSGGTSTCAKCNELGVDYGKNVVFQCEKGDVLDELP